MHTETWPSLPLKTSFVEHTRNRDATCSRSKTQLLTWEHSSKNGVKELESFVLSSSKQTHFNAKIHGFKGDDFMRHFSACACNVCWAGSQQVAPTTCTFGGPLNEHRSSYILLSSSSSCPYMPYMSSSSWTLL